MRGIIFILLLSPFILDAQDCDSVPELNQKIVRLAEGKVGRKVDRGECWDLANYVLTETDAKWDGLYVYGDILQEGECIFPGDILQFERVKVKYKEGNVTYTYSMYHHTAIVLEVQSEGRLLILEQNTGDHGKKVGKSELRLDAVVAGKVLIYRPVSE